jgi:hypothetical protein
MTGMARGIGLGLMFTITGCMAHHATNAPAPAAPSDAAAASGMPGGGCPMDVPGAQVSAVDTQDGEAVTFTTTPDHEADLRARVHQMAAMHNAHHQGGGMEHGGMQQGMHGSMGGTMGPDHKSMMPPPSRAAVEDVPGGARLSVTPNDPADLDQLRSTVRMHADQMSKTHSCGMGQHGD